MYGIYQVGSPCKMKCLDLFSGIGGMTMLLDVEYVSLCEIDPHARAILQKRLPGIPLHDLGALLEGPGEPAVPAEP